MRYLAHLEYMRTVERALRRTGLPVAYSEGFNPHMKLAFASALSVGVTSDAEYADIAMLQKVKATDFIDKMVLALPEGISLTKAAFLEEKKCSLSAIADTSHYRIIISNEDASITFDDLEQAIVAFNAAAEIIYTRSTPKKNKTFSVKDFLWQPLVCGKNDFAWHIDIYAKILQNGSIKAQEIWQVICERFLLGKEVNFNNHALFHRVGLYKKAKDKLLPLL